MAKVYCTGPALIFVKTSPSGNPAFLGTSEFSPYIDIRAGWMPMYSDLGGKGIPVDKSYHGQEAFIFFHLTRWNESVYASLASRPGAPAPGNPATRGKNQAVDVGTMMNAEQKSYPVWVVFPFHTFFADMPAGYHFFNAWLEGPDRLDPIGTDARGLDVLFYASYDIGEKFLTLYDFNCSEVSSLAIN